MGRTEVQLSGAQSSNAGFRRAQQRGAAGSAVKKPSAPSAAAQTRQVAGTLSTLSAPRPLRAAPGPSGRASRLGSTESPTFLDRALRNRRVRSPPRNALSASDWSNPDSHSDQPSRPGRAEVNVDAWTKSNDGVKTTAAELAALLQNNLKLVDTELSKSLDNVLAHWADQIYLKRGNYGYRMDAADFGALMVALSPGFERTSGAVIQKMYHLVKSLADQIYVIKNGVLEAQLDPVGFAQAVGFPRKGNPNDEARLEKVLPPERVDTIYRHHQADFQRKIQGLGENAVYDFYANEVTRLIEKGHSAIEGNARDISETQSFKNVKLRALTLAVQAYKREIKSNPSLRVEDVAARYNLTARELLARLNRRIL